jgi:glucosyl-3-phosphoglycerate synthase
VCGLLGPLLLEPGVQFVKAFYRRPFQLGGEASPEGGGRVTELTARPLLNLYYPELAGVRQPLAGEVGARRELLERVPFATGYAVEIAMLIDAWNAVGLDAMAQVDLDVRQNRHQPLHLLSEMAYAVLCGVVLRAEREGRASGIEPGVCLIPDGEGLTERTPHLEERPPMASLAPA